MTNTSNVKTIRQEPAALVPGEAAHAVEADRPIEKSSWTGKLLALAGAIVSVLYLSNLGWGVFEIIPDNIPGVGNLDEVLFSVVLIACLRKLGIDILPMLRGGLPRGVRGEDRERRTGDGGRE